MSNSLTWRDDVRQLRDLVPWPRNPRDIDTVQAERLRESLVEFDQPLPIAIGPDGEVYDGHQRLKAWIEERGPNFEVAVRVSSRALTEKEREKLTVMLHKGAVGDWDWEALREWDAGELVEWGFSEDELGEWFEGDGGEAADDPGPQIDRAGELLEKWAVERGQVWQVGRHRIMCGDSTSEEDVGRLMGGERVRLLISDPPYCSGGFQEAGRKSGSVGTRGTELVRNDQLSTRGYQSLIRRVLQVAEPTIAYLFTDWRMWVVLFDVIESVGLGVRAMIVWDKQSPGMGRGWRHQHELVMCGTRESQPFDPHVAQGDVIQCGRTGNVNHATEKPVDLISIILKVTDMHESAYDPFLGSGTTLVACEQTGRTGYGMEIEPLYVAVSLERLAAMGLEARLVEQ